LGRSPRLREL